jgi:outer membrane murein-binding lipoprotein Lpp
VHSRCVLAGLFVLVFVLAGCGDDGTDDPDPAAQDRVEELEGELDEARSRIDELEERNDALEADLRAAREDGPADEPEDPQDADDADADDAGDAGDAGEGTADGTEPPDWPTEVAQERTAEGLIDQLRLHVRDLDDAEMPEGWQPGTTEWEPFELPDEVRGTYDTPGEIVAELAAVLYVPQLGQDTWETTVRVLLDEDDPDLAYGAVLGWGFLDDAVLGEDIRITLTRTEDERWEAGGAEVRAHCMRGVDGTMCR